MALRAMGRSRPADAAADYTQAHSPGIVMIYGIYLTFYRQDERQNGVNFCLAAACRGRVL